MLEMLTGAFILLVGVIFGYVFGLAARRDQDG